jgi:hypothetical protein
VAIYRFTARIEVSGEVEVSDEVMNTENEPSPESLQADLETVGVTVDFAEDMVWDIAGHPARTTLSSGTFELEDVDVGEAGH